ncbi:MAG TPA: COX15/CtaA family protein [Kiritimatiellia bacterium]|nr:COX15/CtaA family protein [Kiritimatiellia bacterium]
MTNDENRMTNVNNSSFVISSHSSFPQRSVVRWLDIVCLLILLMVLVGGVTRLTESGLSMVTWEPILGAIPPRTEVEWQARFDQYRAYPEYQLINKGMSLAEFKFIYFWEYLHRLLGRLIGLVYALPMAWFIARGAARGRLAGHLLVGLLLGGLQGVVGWWMVKSGLNQNPYVSPFRLAIHLGLALFVLSYLWWLRLGLAGVARVFAPPPFRRNALLFLVLLVVQIFYGALVAGLNAGYMYNTFPLMLGRVFPPGLLGMEPVWLNFFENATAVQWIHRALGWLVLAAAGHVWWHGLRGANSGAQRRALHAVGALTLLQFALGVAALLLKVPVWLGVAHQVNAALLLLAAVSLVYGAGRRYSPSSTFQ